MKIKKYLGTAVLGFSLFYSTSAGAADTLLAQTDLELAAGETVTAELWGDCLPGGYANDLLIMLKNEDGRLLTAYAPTIRGGYNCQLQPVKLYKSKKQSQQLLISAGRGDWRAPSEYRVLSFANKKKVREVFGAAESMGLVTNAYARDGKMYVSMTDGNKSELLPAAGAQLEDGQLDFGGLHSLTAHDVDDDGCDELIGSQQLGQKRQVLADVGAVWKQDRKTREWKQYSQTIMTLAPVPKENTVNNGKDFDGAAVLARKMVVPGGEATFPVYACRDAKLQNKINKLLAAESADYLQEFYSGRADMAFKVMHADEKILSIQLISGKTSFVHHQINLDPQTGEALRLDELLDSQNKDLFALLNVLNTNEKVTYKDKLPEEWYIEGENLFLLQNVEGTDQVSGFAIGNLHKYLLDRRFLPQKTD